MNGKPMAYLDDLFLILQTIDFFLSAALLFSKTTRYFCLKKLFSTLKITSQKFQKCSMFKLVYFVLM